jgi:hypothetical protein
MDTINWIYSGMSILGIMGILAGLWIAGRFLPAFMDWIRHKVNNHLLSQPAVKIILWLALGGLFTLPLQDIVRWLGNLANIVFLPVGPGANGFTTSLGLIPTRAYYGFSLFLMLAIYGIVIWITTAYLPTAEQFTRTERIFVELTIASLSYHAVYNIFSYIFLFQLPPNLIQQNYGIAGFLFEVAIGFAVLLLILLGLNRFMPTHPPSGIASEQ